MTIENIRAASILTNSGFRFSCVTSQFVEYVRLSEDPVTVRIYTDGTSEITVRRESVNADGSQQAIETTRVIRTVDMLEEIGSGE